MDIEQIGLLVVGWFAGGFLLALALGKILREANQPDRLEAEESVVVREAFHTPARRKPQHRPTSRTRRAKSKVASL
jgi:hypothetical protein